MIFSVCYASDVQVQVNGDVLNFADSNGNVVNPQIINSRTMVPFRKIFNALNIADENITWIAETRTIKAKQGDVQIELHKEVIATIITKILLIILIRINHLVMKILLQNFVVLAL